MKTLEIKHLAAYLPYGLKLQYIVRGNVEKTGIMKSIIHNEGEIHPTKTSIEFGDEEHIWMFKPILRNLSDLTKEIEHNGERFVPLLELFQTLSEVDLVDYRGSLENPSYQVDDGWNHCLSFNNEVEDLCFSYSAPDKSFLLMINNNESWITCQYELFQKLLEWHFDIFNLIPAGLAIDMNTLK